MKMLITLAWRNLWRKKRRTLITVSSVMFAALLSIALLSMMTGMREQMVQSLISNSTGYIQIQDVLYHDEPIMDHSLEYGDEVKGVLEKYADEIAFTVPRIQGFCLGAREMGTRGVFVMGIKPEMEDRMNNLSSRMTEGNMFSDNDNYAVVAAGLATQLELSIGDTIVLLGQGFQGMTAAGKFKVGGIIEFVIPEQNNTMVYLPLKQAQWFFAAPDRLNSLIVMVEDNRIVESLTKNLQTQLDDEWYAVRTWEELLPDTVSAFDARDAQVKIMSWILYIVVGFGIFGTVITMMYERMREFGILLSIGMKRSKLAAICLLETIFICLFGVMCGILIGFLITFRLHKNPIQLTGEFANAFLEFGIKPIYKFSIAPEVFIYQGATIFIIALIVGLYPIRKIFKLDMVSAARK